MFFTFNDLQRYGDNDTWVRRALMSERSVMEFIFSTFDLKKELISPNMDLEGCSSIKSYQEYIAVDCSLKSSGNPEGDKKLDDITEITLTLVKMHYKQNQIHVRQEIFSDVKTFLLYLHQFLPVEEGSLSISGLPLWGLDALD